MATMNVNGGFAFEDQDMGLFVLGDMDTSSPFDSSCPSTSGSFSSSSSSPSQYEPCTPTFRTPEPQQYPSFEATFDDAAMYYEYTPPHSATLGAFPQDFNNNNNNNNNKSTVVPNMLTQHGLPSTPTRCSVFDSFDSTLSSHQSLDFSPIGNIDSCNLLFDPTSLPLPDNSPTNFEAWDPYNDTDPIIFPSPSMHLYPSDTSPSLSPSYGQTRRRRSMDRPQQSSMMLQMQTMNPMPDVDLMIDDIEQQEAHFESTFPHVMHTPSKPRSSRARPTAAKPAARSAASHRVSRKAYSVHEGRTKCNKVSSTRYRCQWPNCTSSYRRPEHLIRHMKGHGGKFVVCHFCPNGKRFPEARKDNYIEHVWRHCVDKPGTRTTFKGAEALALHAQLVSERKSKKTKDNKPPNDASGSQPRAGKAGGIKTK